MRKTLLTVVSVGIAATACMADITVNVAPTVSDKTFRVEYGYIADMLKPQADRPEVLSKEMSVTDGGFTLETLPLGAAQYVIPTGDREYIMIYTAPGDNLTVTINGTTPLDYTVTGSRLMEDIARMDMESGEVLRQFQAMASTGQPDPAGVEAFKARYDRIFKDYIAEHPDAAAVPFAVLHFDGDEFLDAYNNMTPAARESPIAPFLEPQKEYVERKKALEKRREELQSGTMESPAFTFKDLEGKDVSLSDFRGKWVIIDFWGSWCPWCIKGFPELKEAYAKYAGELEVVGIDCRDPEEKWREAVKKYDLPWVNLYNPEERGGKVIEEYAVEGFPTKVIVDPKGVVKNVTAGHLPEFYTILEELMKK